MTQTPPKDNPVPYLLVSIFLIALGFLYIGTVWGEQLAPDEWLGYVGIGFVIAGLGLTILSQVKGRLQGKRDSSYSHTSID